MSNKAYFAQDGSFGDAEDLDIIDVSKWTEADWNEIQNESDEYRLGIARFIAQRYENKTAFDSSYVIGDTTGFDDKGGKVE